VLWLLTSCPAIAGAEAGSPVKFTVLSYHEIAERNDALLPGYAVSPRDFARQMQWLKDSGYHFISIDDVLADEAGHRPLPQKAVLVTFDDGYHSVYTSAFPVIKALHVPVVIAVVGSWLEPDSGNIDFDGRSIARGDLLSWAEIRDMIRSGLVEIASHSYALHHGVAANPQGNLQPAGTARRWIANSHSYEKESAYRRRVAADLRRNNALLRSRLGTSPRVIVWPYGRYNIEARSIAAKVGMRIGLTLDDGPNTVATPLWGLRRVLVQPDLGIEGLDREIQLRNRAVVDDGHPGKIMHIDLDYIYDADPVQQEDNLSRLLERIVAMGVNTVYLQAYADPDGNGAADSVYFPSRHVPMRADLFNRVAWQIETRTRVRRVYAWMPMLAWQLPAHDPAANDRVVTAPSVSNHLSMGYPRLSPFSPRARKAIREIYADLARSTEIDGLLFHDDVTLSDYEDGSRWALQTYRKWGLPQSLPELRADDGLLRRWAELKTRYLDDFATELAGVVREEQPGLETARNLYASVVLNPYSQTWYSQSFESSLAHYDYTAIMAMPYMEQAPDPMAFLRQIFDKVAERPGAMGKVVFELQSVNWRNDDQPLPGTELADTIRTLYSWGARNIAYYPDNLYHNSPDPKQLRPVFDSKPENPPLSDLLH
jgi:biofilm PGA synthesis lipoprotein PgaB